MLVVLDAAGSGPVLVALHTHWMEGATYAPRGGRYTREAYLGDIAALLTHLAIDWVVLVGDSLGGVSAYEVAARRPERVRGLVIEDIGAVESASNSLRRPMSPKEFSEDEGVAHTAPRLSRLSSSPAYGARLERNQVQTDELQSLVYRAIRTAAKSCHARCTRAVRTQRSGL